MRDRVFTTFGTQSSPEHMHHEIVLEEFTKNDSTFSLSIIQLRL
jgi:hypothetical protein